MATAPQDNFLTGSSADYLEALHEQWLEDPASVHKSWQAYFEGASFTPGPGVASVRSVELTGTGGSADVAKNLAIFNLIRSYQERGHMMANLDPLGILQSSQAQNRPDVLKLETYGLGEGDMATEFAIPQDIQELFPKGAISATLSDIVGKLEASYCKNIGFEYMHIQERDRCTWLRQQIEVPFKPYDTEMKEYLAKGLVAGHGFESILEKKFGSEKRFGLDGCESLIPGMNTMIERASANGVENMVIGMPHRGRLNVLHNVMQKPIEMIFNEFNHVSTDQEGSGDVKYHLGMSSDVDCKSGKSIHLSLLANPSHLETVDPVVQGKVRAQQLYKGDSDRKRVMPVLLHGDAAFSGQGVVYETFGLAELPAYTTGGTIHIVVNNQVGFTTDPRSSRSSLYCSDVAKFVSAPILHVNGDDMEAVARCFEIAVDWRQEFGTDVVLDIVCFRRNGHNETDQPMFTQPTMYTEINKHPGTITLYEKQLLDEGSIVDGWVAGQKDLYEKNVNEAFDQAGSYQTQDGDYFSSNWSKIPRNVHDTKVQNTGLALDEIEPIVQKISEQPGGVNIHAGLKRVLKGRAGMLTDGKLNPDFFFDWATGEALSFGSLLLEGTHVRLSGQDVERGTFSHRHHVYHDQVEDGKTYTPLCNLSEDQAPYTVTNSHLSEYAVLGFELGYSGANPNSLVIWEAQFGDFANTAQCVIDQFISAGQAKWGRQSGLVMQLPHGYEGMGPEHSSARLERFLQMCDDDEDVFPEWNAADQIQNGNWQVVNPTTPANVFHLLRRQVHRDFRKPLIFMTPKSLLRHPRCKSSMQEIAEGTRFKRFYTEQDPAVWSVGEPSTVRKLILCSGKVYYDLLAEREALGVTDVAISRVEQISPFPFDLVQKHADDFPGAEIVWVQEEPRNMGPWTYVDPRIETALRESAHHSGTRASYVGRGSSASTATGDKNIHKIEVKQLLADAFA